MIKKPPGILGMPPSNCRTSEQVSPLDSGAMRPSTPRTVCAQELDRSEEVCAPHAAQTTRMNTADMALVTPTILGISHIHYSG